MASDPQADRIRLVIEPEEEEPKILGPGDEAPVHQRPEDMIDLGRLDDDPDYEFEDEDEPPARRRILPVALAAIALAGFGAITWYAYQGVVGSVGDEMIPVIQADAGPIKTRPAVPGGIDVPHQDRLVLNDVTPDPDQPQVERLLPPLEVPKPPAAGNEQRAETGSVPLPADPQPDRTAGATGEPGGGLALSPTLKTSEGELAEPAVSDTTATKLPSAPGPAPTLKDLVVAAPPKAEPVPTPPTPSAAATQIAAIPGGYLVQLAALKDKKLVGGEWVRLQKAFPKLLADKKLVLQEIDLGSRGVFHRVRAGYFPDQKSASELCQALKAKNQACIVVKL